MSRDSSVRPSSSWFGSIASLLGGAMRQPAAKRHPHQRKLSLEPLEQRSLLSVNMLGAIGGTAYFDAHADGLTADDVGLANVTVKLYQDGGNGTFDGGAAGGDDTLLTSKLTDTSGNYRFDSLAAGKYFVQQTPTTGYVLGAGTDVKTVTITDADLRGALGVVIDSFDTSSQAAASFSHGLTASSTAAAPEAVGGQRDLIVQVTTPYGSLGLGANTDVPGVLDFSAGSGSNGVRRIVWDGSESGASILDPNGLNDVDLTSQGASSGIRLSLGGDHSGGTLVLKVFSDATNWSSATIVIPNTDDGTANQEAFVSFSSFSVGGGTGADFSKVGAIQLDINGPKALDGQLDGIEAIGPMVFACNFANLAQTDLGIVKSESPNPAIAGQQLTYTLTSTNSGPSTATGVTVTDTLPAGVSYVSATASQGWVGFASGVLTVHLGSLASGASATTTVVVSVGPGTTGVLTNTGAITGNETDPNLENNTSTVTTQLGSQVDLAIVKTDTPDPVTAGQQLTYTLTSTNNGPSNATGVTIIDTLPPGVSYVSATSSQGAVSYAGGTVTVGLGNLVAGASATTTIIVAVDSSTRGSITNTAVISGHETETNLANNQSKVATVVDPPIIIEGDPDIDLVITKQGLPSPVIVGNYLTYTLFIANRGPDTATGVTVVDTLPAGVSVVSTSSTQGSTDSSGSTVNASLGTLAKDATATVTIIVSVNPGVAATITNTASVTGNENDSDPTNNEDSVATSVQFNTLTKRRFLGR